MLQRAGWKPDDLDLIEANEAFAAQALAVNKDLGWDTGKVNVNGGAIAIGHPIGASGARVLVTLLHEMQKRDAKKGLATLCIGGGMGVAMAPGALGQPGQRTGGWIGGLMRPNRRQDHRSDRCSRFASSVAPAGGKSL